MMTKLIDKVQPEYPASARHARLEGTAVVRLNVDPDGCPVGLVPVSGPSTLVDAVIRVVFHWRYSPTVVNGQAMWVDTTVSVMFSLNEGLAPRSDTPATWTLIRMKSGSTITADSAREVGDKVEYTKGGGIYRIPKILVQEISHLGAAAKAAVPGVPAGTLVVTPRTALVLPSAIGDWPPYESTQNIRNSCVDDGYDASRATKNVILGARSCAIWQLDMGAEYEARVDRGLELRRKLCSAIKNGPNSSLTQAYMRDAAELQRIGKELLQRQSIERFNRVLSTRITVDYNRLAVACPD